MSVQEIHYDPLKEKIGRIVSRNVTMRRLFYTALGALFLRQWHVRAELKRLARELSSWSVFDAGSGYGQYTYLMGRLLPDAHILAVDVKPEQIDDCRWFTEKVGQKNAEFQEGDLTEFRKEDSFDLALSVDVMEHVLEDRKVYDNVFASLRAGGRFIVATPSAVTETVNPPEGEAFSVVGEHVREGYTEREFREKITTAGFKVDKLKYTYGPVWGKIAWMILQRIPMKLLTASKLFAVIVIPWMILLYPLAAFAMWRDVRSDNRRGGGWIMVARKS